MLTDSWLEVHGELRDYLITKIELNYISYLYSYYIIKMSW